MSQYHNFDDLSEMGRIYVRSVEKLAAIHLPPKENHISRISQEDLAVRYPTLCHLRDVMRAMETLAAYSIPSRELDQLEHVLRDLARESKEHPSFNESSYSDPRERKGDSGVLDDPTVRAALVDIDRIAAFFGQMRYVYPDLCYACKHRDDLSREYCLHCMAYQNVPGMEDTRASNFERKNKKMEE